MGLLDTNRAQRPTTKPQPPTVAPRTTGGITGPGKANVDKVYQQMEELKKNVSPPSTLGAPAPKKTRSTYESNRMQ